MRRRWLKISVGGLLLLAVIGASEAQQGPSPASVPARGVDSAQETWKQEFDEVCSKTDDATSLSSGELKDLIARSDRLRARIESADETVKKVYLRRLQMCRELYQYLLDLKKGKE